MDDDYHRDAAGLLHSESNSIRRRLGEAQNTFC